MRLYGSPSMRAVFTLLTLFGLAATVPAWAGSNANAVVVLHAKAHTGKTPTTCTTWSPNGGTPIPCSSYVTKWPTMMSADVYLVVARGDATAGVVGVSCGISYDAEVFRGVDVLGWSLCGDLENTSAPDDELAHQWPYPGSGNRITWVTSDCQRFVVGTDGVHAVAGCFYVYAYGVDNLAITPNYNVQFAPELAVADCSARVDYLPWSRAATVAFSPGGSVPGYNPCGGSVPIDPTTWGQLKQRFGG